MGQRVSDRYKPTLNKLLILSTLRFGCHCGRADTEYVRARRQRGEMWNVIPCMHHNNSLIIGLHQMWHWVHVRPALSTTRQGREGAPALSFTSELLALDRLGSGGNIVISWVHWVSTTVSLSSRGSSTWVQSHRHTHVFGLSWCVPK